jgi:hypothetical protein
MRRILIFSLALGLLCAVVPLALAQGTSSIRGVVVDEQGGVLPGVTVTGTHAETGLFRLTVTGPEGQFALPNLQPGLNQVTAELQGFRQLITEDIVLAVGLTAQINLTLLIGELEESVTVTGTSPLVDLTSAQVGGNVASEELRNLPSGSRNFTSFIALLPGVQLAPSSSPSSAGVRINSQSQTGIMFMLDGGANNDDLRGGQSQAKPALEAIAEFQVITNQMDAENESATSGVINAISKTGTNTFSGSAFGFYTSGGLTTEGFFVKQQNLVKPDTVVQQYGGTIGGPIVQDKAHFFVSYERLNLNLGQSRHYPSRPDLSFSSTLQSNFDNYLFRVDNQVNASHNYSVRFLWDHQPTNGDPAGNRTLETVTNERDDDWTLVGTENWVLGNTAVNTFRASWTFERPIWGSLGFHDTGDQRLELPTIVLKSGMITQADSFALGRTMQSYQMQNALTWFIPTSRGDHDLKFGAQYNNSQHRREDMSGMNGVFSMASDLAFDAANPFTYPERLTVRLPVPDTPYTTVHSAGLYIQDKWQIDSLTLNLGVRYDVQIAPIHAFFNPLFDDPDAYPIDKNNIAPRLGFAYDLSGNSVIRAGFGRFYERLWVDRFENFVRRGVYASSFDVSFPIDDNDPGPSAGVLPTHALLVNGPVLNRALLDTIVPAGSLNRNLGSVWLDTPERPVAHQDSLTFGYERELGGQVSVGIDYIHLWGRDLPLRYNLNPQVRSGTGRNDPVTRVDFMGLANQLGVSAFGSNVYTIENNASSQYDGLNFQIEKRFSNNWGGRVAYTRGYARGNNDGDPNDELNVFQVLEARNLNLLWGPSTYDRGQLVTASGQVELPGTGGVTLSAVARYMGATPFTVHNSNFDLNQNGVRLDPVAPGTYSGTGQNAITVENAGGLRGAYGLDYFQLDLRIGYRARMDDQRTVDFFAEIFNATNRVNFVNPTGDMRSGNFLVPTRLLAGGYPRQIQLGVRLGF